MRAVGTTLDPQCIIGLCIKFVFNHSVGGAPTLRALGHFQKLESTPLARAGRGGVTSRAGTSRPAEVLVFGTKPPGFKQEITNLDFPLHDFFQHLSRPTTFILPIRKKLSHDHELINFLITRSEPFGTIASPSSHGTYLQALYPTHWRGVKREAREFRTGATGMRTCLPKGGRPVSRRHFDAVHSAHQAPTLFNALSRQR